MTHALACSCSPLQLASPHSTRTRLPGSGVGPIQPVLTTAPRLFCSALLSWALLGSSPAEQWHGGTPSPRASPLPFNPYSEAAAPTVLGGTADSDVHGTYTKSPILPAAAVGCNHTPAFPPLFDHRPRQHPRLALVAKAQGRRIERHHRHHRGGVPPLHCHVARCRRRWLSTCPVHDVTSGLAHQPTPVPTFTTAALM